VAMEPVVPAHCLLLLAQVQSFALPFNVFGIQLPYSVVIQLVWATAHPPRQRRTVTW
jgi:hypothetical protein